MVGVKINVPYTSQKKGFTVLKMDIHYQMHGIVAITQR